MHGARVELNRKTGHVTVMVPEYDEDGQQIGEYDDTPRASAGWRLRPPAR